MRSAFVDLVVVGIFAREQTSLRSATLRDFLWESERRGRGGRGERGIRTVLRPFGGKRGGRGARDERVSNGRIGQAQARAVTVNGPIMEDGINQLFHPAYPLPPQHQSFPDSHDVVQDQYHRMFFSSSQPSLTIPIQQPLTSTAFTIVLLPQQMTIPPPRTPPRHLAMNPSRRSPTIHPPLPKHLSLSHLSTMNLFM